MLMSRFVMSNGPASVTVAVDILWTGNNPGVLRGFCICARKARATLQNTILNGGLTQPDAAKHVGQNFVRFRHVIL